VQGVVPVSDAGVAGLFDNDLLKAEIVIAHPAIFFIRPHHEETLFPRFEKGLPVDNPRLSPLLHMRHDLGRQELAVGVAEHVLLFAKISG
jgi:hypothetical protein